MTVRDGAWGGSIPAAYAGATYPLQYYFEIEAGRDAWLHPGFAPDLLSQPYFVLRRA